MQHPVEDLQLQNNSTQLQTPTPRHGFLPFQAKDYTFETFMEMCEQLKPRYIRISSRKDGLSIIFGITKKYAYFGRATTFAEAYQKLLADMGNTLP